jgi:hypothetical protein
MLSAPDLPLPVRAKVLEYLAEKAARGYGDTERELRRFVRRLSNDFGIDESCASGTVSQLSGTFQQDELLKSVHIWLDAAWRRLGQQPTRANLRAGWRRIVIPNQMEAVMAQSNSLTAMVRGSNAGLLGEFADLFVSLTNLFHGYRPERHYMRGPGPAWRRKARLGSANRTCHPEGDETTTTRRRGGKSWG